MTDSFSYKIVVLSLVGVTMLGVIAIQEIDSDASFLHTDSHPELFWDGSNLILSGPDNDEQKDTGRLVPPRLRPLFFQPIPINAADRDLLMTVPGIGPKTATNIVITREKNGALRHPDDLLLVHGIGPKKRTKLANYFSY